MKKILILGTGESQVDLIRYCKKSGLEVYACSPDKDESGVKEVDHFKLIDITQISKIKEYVIENAIDLIYSMGSNLALITIYLINEELALPGFLSAHSVIHTHDKGKTRSILGIDFRGNPKWITVKQLNEINFWDVFPCIIKPVDNSGQRGVYLVNNMIELERAFSLSILLSKKREVIIEEFVDGSELSVHGYLVNNNLVFLHISDRITDEKISYGIAIEHRSPSIFTQYKDEIYKMVAEICSILKISNGPVYLQLKIGTMGIKLLEVTPRLDGCHLWKLIRIIYGVDLIDITMRHLLYKHVPEFIVHDHLIPHKLVFNYNINGSFGIPSETQEKLIFTHKYYNNFQAIRKSKGFERSGYSIMKS
ncbi:acetyl-CoA carboxylase biotin carboxylase subunit family protein [Bacteroidota bacterium]